MPKWNVRRRPGRILGLLLLVILSILVLRRVNWHRLTPLWLRHWCLGLPAKGQNFMLEDSAFWIFGGSVHYFRVPREYWRDRLLKMKACGLNTLTTYVPWNLHEPERGKFDFSGNLDLEAFVLLAAEVGLWVILCPGPYICGEMDLGGLPSWLLQDPDMRLRTTYKGFTKAVDLYFDHLMVRVVPLQYKHGGPIIAVQVENEYGSYNKDPAYMPYVKKALEDRGIVELLLTSDNKDGLSRGIVDGVLATINLQSQHELQFLTTFLLSVQGVQPRMVMECWTGWFDSWGGPYSILDSAEGLKTVSAIINAGLSANLSMFHGGTNFGFIGGAVHFQDYKSDVTSYDYDAVLTEAGDYTAKYTELREFFGSVSGAPLPAPPDLLPETACEPVMPALYLSLWDALPYLEEPVTSEKPVNMETLPINGGNGQSFGYTLYETTITSAGILSAYVRDQGQVFVNTVSIGFLDYKREKVVIPSIQGFTMLRILVEHRGRVNYGTNIDDQRKGLIGNIYLNDSPLKKFKIYSLDMKKSFFQRFHADKWNPVPDVPVFPAFFLGPLLVSLSPCDTFVKLEGWEKGVVFIDGQNLGRSWNLGPQETLYLPGAWLDQGLNQVIVFEEKRAGPVIQFTETPCLGRHQYLNRAAPRPPGRAAAGPPAHGCSPDPPLHNRRSRLGAREGPSPKSFPALWLLPSTFTAPAGGMGGLAGTVPRGGEWGTAPGQSARSVPVGPVSEPGRVTICGGWGHLGQPSPPSREEVGAVEGPRPPSTPLGSPLTVRNAGPYLPRQHVSLSFHEGQCQPRRRGSCSGGSRRLWAEATWNPTCPTPSHVCPCVPKDPRRGVCETWQRPGLCDTLTGMRAPLSGKHPAPAGAALMTKLSLASWTFSPWAKPAVLS
ncbi:LOW QUALITY PROTEIN: beta-galactosidase-1-like protein 2 [Pseudorca crassidens]|uniref:LOW QUALITY PROTEIN: beta-galactosidase-1-like protein 2 n=2 Tax=Delphinidae TaxID=9726 RepID=UPI00352FB9D7